jgi:hypothetical protein
MDPQAVLQALSELWDQLPSLIGPTWVDLFPRVQALIRKLQTAQDDTERDLLTADIIMLLRAYPQARDQLYETVERLESERRSSGARSGNEMKIISPPDWEDTINKLSGHLEPPLETRYTDITAPRRLALGERGAITIRLTRASEPESRASQPLTLQLKQFVEIYLHAPPDEFEVIGEPVQRLMVEPDRDTEPVAFLVKARSLGRKFLALDFWQNGALIGTARLQIDVTQEGLAETQTQVLAERVYFGGPYAPPPDLDLRVNVQLEAGQTVLSYTLHSANGVAPFHFQPAGRVVIHGSPEQYQERLMLAIENLAQRRDADNQLLTPQQAASKLQGIGHNLYTELFPTELRADYRRFRGLVRTLQITSDEPWIPWELVKPYDSNDPDQVIDDDYLCLKFELTRWIAGGRGGSGQVQVPALTCIAVKQAPGHQPLPFVEQERDYLAQFVQSQATLQDFSPAEATLASLEALMDASEPIGLWHFATHGDWVVAHANEAIVVLADGRKLRPTDLHGPRQARIGRDRPLVFLNACRVGQQGWSLAQLGGWAAAWVDRCRCGAFIGPLWSVDDALACTFARTFYDALWDGKTIGQATQTARLAIRHMNPTNATWLAYSVYAHPNARLTVSK